MLLAAIIWNAAPSHTRSPASPQSPMPRSLLNRLSVPVAARRFPD